MSGFTHILLNISLPIIILIGLGFGLQKIFNLDVRTLVKLNIYLTVPAMVFVKLYTSDLSSAMVLQILPFYIILIVALFLISQLLSVFLSYDRRERKAMGNIFILNNTGNYGIPLIDLTFSGDPIAVSSNIIIIIMQNIISSTFCVYQASAGKSSTKQALLNVIKIPSIYAIALAVLFKSFNVTVPSTIAIPLDYITNMFVAFALVTLGAKLAEVKAFRNIKKVVLITAVKMLLAPVLAFGIVKLLGIEGVLAQALIIGISTPVAVNAAIIAKEFDNKPDFTAQIVFATTIFCTFTLPFVIFFVPKLL